MHKDSIPKWSHSEESFKIYVYSPYNSVDTTRVVILGGNYATKLLKSSDFIKV